MIFWADLSQTESYSCKTQIQKMDYTKESLLIKQQFTEKITQNDYTSARFFLLETLKTFPRLEHASELLTISEILCSAKPKSTVNDIDSVNKVDFYGVLQIFPSDDAPAVESQYRSILSLLEPVRDELVGASLALRFVDEAYAVLSDPVKRADFDAKRRILSYINGDSPSSSGNKRKFPDFCRFEEAQNEDFGTEGNKSVSISNEISNFENGQVWLGFKNGDKNKIHGRYAKIISILPEKTRVFVNWYEPSPKSQVERRWCDLGLPVSCGDFRAQENEEIEINGNKILTDLLFSIEGNDRGLQIYPKKGEVWAIYKNWSFNWDKETLEKCEYDLVEIIANFSEDYGVKVAYLEKVEGSKNVFQRKFNKNGNDLNYDDCFIIPTEKLYMFSHLITAFWSNGTFELDPLKIPNNLSENLPALNKNTSIFIGTKTLNDFSDGQIWAVFVPPDFMPRQYVKIINKISGTQLQVSFLEPHPMTDEEINWTEEEFPFSCGVFRKNPQTKTLHISAFSHLIKCDYSAKRNYFRIFPKKGEVWAIFKNRGVNLQNSQKGEFCRENFRFVEILSEYFSEERRINVGSLTEADGALTFFERQFCDGFRLTKWIGRSEMLGFSHRVVAFRVTGQKRPGLPDFVLQLEPSALPIPKELL
ncbi:hypothetical protein LUZ60_002038 [Juncus effusus]|nr:hypothetical protein LUZ60_002038 [Juncus effusus]